MYFKEDVVFRKYKKHLMIILLSLFLAFAGCSQDSRQQSISKKHEVVSKNKNRKISQAEKVQQKEDIDSSKVKEKVVLDVPIISQYPELQNGCEVTSLAMLLNYAGIQVDKMILADKVIKDDIPLTHDDEGNILQWGNPDEGFVGDITGEEVGFGVYDKPILELLNQYMPNRGVNLTNQSFHQLIKSINKGKPVIVWITISYESPKEYKKWKKGAQTIKATFEEHAVVLVGYDKKYCYINDPASGKKAQKIKKSTFKKIWSKMGKMAVSYV